MSIQDRQTREPEEIKHPALLKLSLSTAERPPAHVFQAICFVIQIISYKEIKPSVRNINSLWFGYHGILLNLSADKFKTK